MSRNSATASLDDVNWPVLRIGRPDCAMQTIATKEQLTRATFLGLTALAQMKCYHLIDSDGVVFELSDPIALRYYGTLQRLVMLLFNPTIAIDFRNVVRQSQLDVAQVQELVIKEIKADLDFWGERGEPDELVSDVASCKTIREIIQLF
jgi:hypothetical protein